MSKWDDGDRGGEDNPPDNVECVDLTKLSFMIFLGCGGIALAILLLTFRLFFG